MWRKDRGCVLTRVGRGEMEAQSKLSLPTTHPLKSAPIPYQPSPTLSRYTNLLNAVCVEIRIHTSFLHVRQSAHVNTTHLVCSNCNCNMKPNLSATAALGVEFLQSALKA